jgi:hypothetical protein
MFYRTQISWRRGNKSIAERYKALFGIDVCPKLGTLTGLQSFRLNDFIHFEDHIRASSLVWAPRILVSITTGRTAELRLGGVIWVSHFEGLARSTSSTYIRIFWMRYYGQTLFKLGLCQIRDMWDFEHGRNRRPSPFEAAWLRKARPPAKLQNWLKFSLIFALISMIRVHIIRLFKLCLLLTTSTLMTK